MSGVSVIIPLFNREKFIAEAIQSVLDQQLAGTLEIIVSDDGSTDNGVAIAGGFGSLVKVLLKPDSNPRRGVSGARNRGIEAATQPYMSFLDSDDYYLPGHLNKMVALMDANPEAGFAFSRSKELRDIGGKWIDFPWTHSRVTARDIAYLLLSRHHVVNANVFLIRTKIFRNVGLFNRNFTYGEDADMWMRISEQYTGLFADHFGAVYRTNHGVGEQQSAAPPAEIRKCALQIYMSALERCRANAPRDEYREFSLMVYIARIQLRTEFRLYYFVKLIKLLLKNPKLFSMKIYDYLLKHFQKFKIAAFFFFWQIRKRLR
ncbi:MAG TPA: glycosyltransferase [Smithella sp.]|nr:glycosyltransferase [Smithella sp.]